MTKKIIVIILLIATVFLLCECDDPSITKTSNTKAYIKMNEKIIVIDVDAYNASRSNGSIIVYGIDGEAYTTHLVNVVLVTDTEGR